MSDVRAFARDGDGTETDITEGVQALYDLVIGSMDWGSGFLTAEDARPVALLARTLGFEQAETAERYLRDQEHSDQQQQFLRERGGNSFAMVSFGGFPLPHDHVFSTAGRCMWPQCRELGEMDPAVSDEDAADIALERDYWLGQLQDIPGKRAQLEQDEQQIVTQARFAGITWNQIAAALGYGAWWMARDKYGEPGGDPF